MRATLVRAASAAQVRKPLIRFLGRRPSPSEVHANEHHPHPTAPQDIKDTFKELFSRYENGSSSIQSPEQRRSGSGSGPANTSVAPRAPGETGAAAGVKGPNATGSVSYNQFWEAPARLWKGIELTEKEIETVTMGGAP